MRTDDNSEAAKPIRFRKLHVRPHHLREHRTKHSLAGCVRPLSEVTAARKRQDAPPLLLEKGTAPVSKLGAIAPVLPAREGASEPLVAGHSLRSCFRGGTATLASFDVTWFCNLCLAARDLDDVHAILRMVHDGVGAKACALVQVGATRQSSLFELLVNCTDALIADLKARKVSDDAIMVAGEQRVLGFYWSDLERIIEMNDRRRETLAIYAAHGIHEGFTVPLCVPNEPRGFCSFGWADPDDLTMDIMGILVMAVPVLFESARRVQGMWVERRATAELTPRQVDCLAGAARGLNDAEIAHELGISVQTVHDHLEAARKRYGARKRTDLVIKAIRAGDLHWSRITGASPP